MTPKKPPVWGSGMPREDRDAFYISQLMNLRKEKDKQIEKLTDYYDKKIAFMNDNNQISRPFLALKLFFVLLGRAIFRFNPRPKFKKR